MNCMFCINLKEKPNEDVSFLKENNCKNRCLKIYKDDESV